VDVLFGLLRFAAPLVVIALAALWIINRQQGNGKLQIITSVPGAEILLDAQQTGYLTDTTVTVGMGRRIITVRLVGYLSDPEFVVADVRSDVVSRVTFKMKPQTTAGRSDSIPPLHSVRQEIFSTGEPVHAVPPAQRERSPLVDFSMNVLQTEAIEAPFIGFDSTDERRELAWNDTVPVSTSIQGTKVTVSSVPNAAEIIVNGAATPRVTPYTFRGLDRGVYSFSVRRDGFQTRPDSIILTLNHDFQEELAAFELMRDTTLPQPALTVTTAPLAAAIRINGRAAGVGKVTQALDFGTYRVEFSEAPGYRTPDPLTVMLTAGKPQTEVVGTYEKFVGGAFIAVRPGDDFGKFEGNLLRISVDNELIVDRPNEKYAAALIGRVLSGKRLIRVQYGELTGDIHVTALDGEVSEVTMRVESFFSKRKLRLREKSATSPLADWQDVNKKMNVLTIN
jgi:hypothetical protein